jgi:hypothetical protein
MFQTKFVEEIKTHLCSTNFCPENRVIYEIMWKNMAESDKPQMTVQRMRFACWISKATNTHSEYVIKYLLLSSATRVTRMRLNITLRILPLLFHILLLSPPTSSKYSLALSFSVTLSVHFSYLSCMLRVPPLSSYLIGSNNICLTAPKNVI